MQHTIHRIPIICTAFLIGGLWSVPVEGQTRRASSAPGWEMPRTEWGHPDLQGNWTNQSRTPTERPQGYGPTLTQAQVDSIARTGEARIEAGSAPSDPDRAPLKVTGSTGGYNDIYYERGDRVARVNGEPRTSLITFPANGRIPALSTSGERRLQAFQDVRLRFGEADHPEVRTQADRCLVSYGSTLGPPMLPSGGYNSNYTIVQNQDHVLILTEMVHDVRVIPLAERGGDVPGDITPWFGVSWARWEGNTLVVETTNVQPRQMLSPTFDPTFTSSVLLSEDARIEERFTRVDEGTILYEFEVDDLGAYSEKWGGQVPMRRFDDLLYEYACHEGNYAMEGILGGARYQERMLTSQAPSGND
jgi:hypothetical protein